jgi:hypothetical protein
MKIKLFAILFAFLGGSLPGYSETPPPSRATARILGNLSDGIPPPPQPAKPSFIVPTTDILETQIHVQDGRKITVQKISPIALPPPPTAAPLLNQSSPAVQARIAALRANHPKDEFVRIGATVYRSQDSAARTLITCWPDGAEEPVTFWSSADFALLSGFSSFLGSDGQTRSLMMTWSTLDIDRLSEFLAKHGREYQPPAMPELPPGKAAFAITSGNPTAKTLASIQSLHDLYNNEHDRLLTAYQDREHARLQQEAELKAHPPKPKDIILNYWLTNSADQAEKGGAR